MPEPWRTPLLGILGAEPRRFAGFCGTVLRALSTRARDALLVDGRILVPRLAPSAELSLEAAAVLTERVSWSNVEVLVLNLAHPPSRGSSAMMELGSPVKAPLPIVEVHGVSLAGVPPLPCARELHLRGVDLTSLRPPPVRVLRVRPGSSAETCAVEALAEAADASLEVLAVEDWAEQDGELGRLAARLARLPQLRALELPRCAHLSDASAQLLSASVIAHPRIAAWPVAPEALSLAGASAVGAAVRAMKERTLVAGTEELLRAIRDRPADDDPAHDGRPKPPKPAARPPDPKTAFSGVKKGFLGGRSAEPPAAPPGPDAALAPGSAVEVVGLVSASGSALNGSLGTIKGYDRESGRYMVKLGGEGSKKLKAENLQPLAQRNDRPRDAAEPKPKDPPPPKSEEAEPSLLADLTPPPAPAKQEREELPIQELMARAAVTMHTYQSSPMDLSRGM